MIAGINLSPGSSGWIPRQRGMRHTMQIRETAWRAAYRAGDTEAELTLPKSCRNDGSGCSLSSGRSVPGVQRH